jgi:hypothetical protein
MRINSGILLFPKALLGGLGAAIIAWIAILCFYMWRASVERRRLGIEGLGAVSGGWTFLLHSPIVDGVIAVAFALGFYFTVRLLGGAVQ